LDLGGVGRKVPELPLLGGVVGAGEEGGSGGPTLAPSCREGGGGPRAAAHVGTTLPAPRPSADAGTGGLPVLGRSGYLGPGAGPAGGGGGSGGPSLTQLVDGPRLPMSPITARTSPIMPVGARRLSSGLLSACAGVPPCARRCPGPCCVEPKGGPSPCTVFVSFLPSLCLFNADAAPHPAGRHNGCGW
jgi:hypothetical protein